MADALVRETQKLYGVPRPAFTAARNARAKELRTDDPELAASVAGLPKPPLLERGILHEDLTAAGFGTGSTH